MVVTQEHTKSPVAFGAEFPTSLSAGGTVVTAAKENYLIFTGNAGTSVGRMDSPLATPAHSTATWNFVWTLELIMENTDSLVLIGALDAPAAARWFAFERTAANTFRANWLDGTTTTLAMVPAALTPYRVSLVKNGSLYGLIVQNLTTMLPEKTTKTDVTARDLVRVFSVFGAGAATRYLKVRQAGYNAVHI